MLLSNEEMIVLLDKLLRLISLPSYLKGKSAPRRVLCSGPEPALKERVCGYLERLWVDTYLYIIIHDKYSKATSATKAILALMFISLFKTRAKGRKAINS